MIDKIDEINGVDKNDSELFRRVVLRDKHFRPLKDQNKKQEIPKKNSYTTNKIPVNKQSDHTEPTNQISSIALSENLWRPTVLPNEYISYFKPGLQPKTIKQLQAGKILTEAILDLHQKTKTQAAAIFSQFITDSYQKQLRCICVIHGKGLRGDHNQPILKNLVNHWLYEFEEILGFCSCPPSLGGTGAVLVLLKKN
ncbi:MAG: Smr/MutS family protein [Gammaproteobacteria bacterium]|nr:Smr/MutS family protein [Gammaproteobacteria bacterium]